jgi:glycosyltransferase involved in cell wall biosynthesis
LKNKLFVAANTLDLSAVKIIYNKLKDKGKPAVKNELGKNFDSVFNLIFIGRLLPNKRIDLLINAVHLLTRDFDIALHIIGSGEEEYIIKKDPLCNKKIFYYGAIYDDEITGKYLFASDLFVMPGYVGLSIIQAFAFGLPVVTCNQENDGPFHSPEIEYLDHGFNGILSSKDPVKLAFDIKELLEAPSLLHQMKMNAEKTAYDKCTVERMLDGFEKAINFVNR